METNNNNQQSAISKIIEWYKSRSKGVKICIWVGLAVILIQIFDPKAGFKSSNASSSSSSSDDMATCCSCSGSGKAKNAMGTCMVCGGSGKLSVYSTFYRANCK